MPSDYITNLSGKAGQELHITCWDENDQPIDPATITATMPNGVTASIDTSSEPPGFIVRGSVVDSGMAAHFAAPNADGVSQRGDLSLGFTAPTIRFTSP
jgi:hypothetical protein